MNNEKEKGEGGRGETHEVQKLSERHQNKGLQMGSHFFLKVVGLAFGGPTLCAESPPAEVRCTERTRQRKSGKADINDSDVEISQEQTRIRSSTLLRKVRRSAASHYCTLCPRAQVRRW